MIILTLKLNVYILELKNEPKDNKVINIAGKTKRSLSLHSSQSGGYSFSPL